MVSEVASVGQRIRAILPKSTFARQVMVMGGGTAVVQALGVLVSPILTRLYTPADFGLMAVFMSVTGIAVVFATLRYDLAIPIAAADEDDALRLLLLSFISSIAIGITIALLLLALSPTGYRAVSSDPRFVQYRWFLVVAVAGGGFYNALVAWSIRRKAFRALSGSRVFQSSTSIAVQLMVGFLHGGVIGLVLGSMLNMTCGVGNLWRQAAGSVRSAFLTGRWRGLRKTALAYHRYPVFTVWNALVSAASTAIPPVFLSAMYNSEVVGQYALSFRIMYLPATLIASAVAGVYMSREADLLRQGSLGKNMESIAKCLSLIASIILIPMVFFGPDLFSLVFGKSWHTAGLYSQYLMPYLYLSFIFSPMVTTVMLLERQGTDTVWQMVMLFTRLAGIVLGGHLGGPRGAVGILAAVSFVVGALYYRWILSIGGASLRRIVKYLFDDICIAVAISGITWLLFIAFDEPPMLLFLPWILLAGVHIRRLKGLW